MTDTTARPRPRTRARPTAHDDSSEVRTGGATTSETETTEHRPSKSVQALVTNMGLVARVTVRDGVTLNMGDYNSFRRDIGLELDIPLADVVEPVDFEGNLDPDLLAQVNTVADRVQDWVVDRLEGAMEEAQEIMAGN